MSPATILEDTTTPIVLPMRPPLPSVRRPGKPVNAVKCGSLVALGKGGVIEHRIDEVGAGTAGAEAGLPDMQQFAGARADNVHSQKMPCLAMKNNLQLPGGVAPALTAGNLSKISDARL